MSIFDSVAVTINRYGSSIKIVDSGSEVKTKAFIQPLRYKNKVYVGEQYRLLGADRTDKYLYIGLPQNKLIENSSVIEMQNSKYIVKRCEVYYVKDNPIYMWAILGSCGEDLEDDYESD